MIARSDSPTPRPQNFSRDEVSAYYEAMTENYMKYGGEALAFHTALYDSKIETKTAALLRSNELIVAGCELRPGARILDAGCGVGGLCFYLADRYEATIEGISICDAHLDIARKHADERGVGHRVNFRNVDFMTMDGLPDESFDLVLSQEAFCYATHDLDAYFKNVRRVLKPNGQWRVLDGFLAEPTLPHGDHERWMPVIQAGWKLPPLVYWGNVLQLMSKQGFKHLISKDYSAAAYPAYSSFVEQKIKLDILYECGKAQAGREGVTDVFMEHLSASAAFGMGLLKSAFTYRLLGGTRY